MALKPYLWTWTSTDPRVLRREIAFRLICFWFLPHSTTVIVALFAADKARMGDVFYNSVGSRADAARSTWLHEITEDHDE